MAFFEVSNIKKSFGKTEVLKGIDFSLEKGNVLSIIGSSGSGKPPCAVVGIFWEHLTLALCRLTAKSFLTHPKIQR